MTETPPETPPHAWLPADRVKRWLQLDTDADNAVLEDCRTAAASWCEDKRRDLFIGPAEGTAVPDRIVQAGVLSTARLYARRDTPAGLASYAELGAAAILRTDPDVAQLLGIGRYAPPAVG